MEIRRALMSDVPAILAMARAMYRESPVLRPMLWSDERATALIQYAIGSDDALAIVADSGAGEAASPVGMFGGAVARHIFSDDPIAIDYVLYVDPVWRARGVGESLIRVYVDWARSRGARLVQAGVTSGINTDDAVRLYESLGFRVTGKHLTKEV